MNIRDFATEKARKTKIGARLVDDKRFRVISKAVFSLILNFTYAFYNGILGVISSSLIFTASAVYYLLLTTMRFITVLLGKSKNGQRDEQISRAIGIMLMILSIILHVMVFASMKDKTAAIYGIIPMITIATYTTVKITMAAVTAVKHRNDKMKLYRSVNAIRYSEVAVSLLTMQQSMLASFGDSNDESAVILNACTGAAVCFFIFALGISTLKNNKIKDVEND